MSNIEDEIDAIFNSQAIPQLKKRAKDYLEFGIDFYLRNHGIEKLITDYTANDMKSIDLGCRQLCMENRGITKEKPFEQIEKQDMEKLLKILQYTITREETIEKDYYFKIEALEIKSKVGLDCRIYNKVKT